MLRLQKLQIFRFRMYRYIPPVYNQVIVASVVQVLLFFTTNLDAFRILHVRPAFLVEVIRYFEQQAKMVTEGQWPEFELTGTISSSENICR